MRDAFPASYRASRERFVTVARDAGATLTRHEHPQGGSDGGIVATDVASLGAADARRVMVVVSGTHGVEGLCGAGVQEALLPEAGQLVTGVRTVFVHALNPHGFLDLRRTNEDNVDLNRNFVAHDGRYPDDSAYDGVHPWLVPDDWDGRARAAADAALADYARRNGAAALQAAITRGQYTHADGLFYGGRAASWSNRLWRWLLREHCAAATHVAVLDLHSGLGARGACELISGAASASAEYAAAVQYFGERLVFPGVDSTAAAAGGYMGVSLAQTLPNAMTALVVAEFGTRPFDQVLAALRGDNWLHARGGRARASVRNEMRVAMEDAFVGRDSDWQDAVLGRGREIWARALAGLRDAAGAASTH
jgi:predicted deacylase